MEKSPISGTRSILDWICTANTSETIGNVYRCQQKGGWMDNKKNVDASNLIIICNQLRPISR